MGGTPYHLQKVSPYTVPHTNIVSGTLVCDKLDRRLVSSDNPSRSYGCNFNEFRKGICLRIFPKLSQKYIQRKVSSNVHNWSSLLPVLHASEDWRLGDFLTNWALVNLHQLGWV